MVGTDNKFIKIFSRLHPDGFYLFYILKNFFRH
jgi:hypothetical protein